MKLGVSELMIVAVAIAAVIGSADSGQRSAEAAFPGANGCMAFVRQLDLDQGWGEIFVMNADGSNQTQISNHPGFDEHPAWSPDGSKIAFSRRPLSGVGSPADIWVMNPDGSNQTTLMDTPVTHDITPSWSPDGNRIVFSAGLDLKIVNTTDLAVTDLGALGHSPAWSPDGSRIAFIGRTPEGFQSVYMMNADGTNPVNIGASTGVQGNPEWSPDGTRIAFSQQGGVWVMDPSGGNRVDLTEAVANEDSPAWSPDGTKIAVQAQQLVVVMNADGSGLHVLTSDAYFGGLDWQPRTGVPLESNPSTLNCGAATPTPTTSPSPAVAPIPLPRTGGESSDASSLLIAVVAAIAGLLAAGVLFALAGRSRGRF